jgi:hypothetical protein
VNLYTKARACSQGVPACLVLVWCVVPSVGVGPRSPPSADGPQEIGHLGDRGAQTDRSFDAYTYKL